MSRRGLLRLRTSVPILALCAAACGGPGGPSAREARVEVLLRSAPTSELGSFVGTLENVRLVSDSGAATGNLLPAPVELELVGLRDRSALVASTLTRRGTYESAELVFRTDSLRAVNKDGTVVPVLALGDTLRVRLAEPAVLPRNGFRQVRVELDLRASTNGALSPATLGFDPVGSGTGSSSAHREPVDDVKGIVLAKDEAAGRLVVQSFLDDDLVRPLRQMEVRLEPGAYLEDEADAAFPDAAAFFAALAVDTTLVELHGTQDENGVCHAARIEVEDQVGGLDADDLVKIEGYLVSVDSLGTLRLFVQDVEQGLSIATGVLSALGDPTVLDVTFDSQVPVLRSQNQASTLAALAVGQRVKVKFEDFLGTPFPARSIEIVAEANVEAEIDAVNAFQLDAFVRPGEFALQSGLVQDVGTPVRIDLLGADLVLDTPARPALSGLDLRVGQSVNVEGTLSGPPTAPVLEADELRVVPGRFHGRVVAAEPASDRFDSTITLAQGFGRSAPVSSVVIRPECEFRGDAADAVEFFDLFGSLAPGASLNVDVQGIASGASNEVAAYVIEVVSH